MPLWVAHCPCPLSSACSLGPQPSTSKCLQHKDHSIWKTGKELRKWPPLLQGLSQCLRVHCKVSSSSVHSEENYVEKGARRFERRGSYFERKDEIQREMRAMSEAKGQGGKGISRNKGFFRVFRVEVLLEKDLGKDSFEVSDAVLESTAAALGCLPGILPQSALSVIRKSFDARKNPRFVYTVELDIEECLKQKPSIKSFLSRLRDKPSKLEFSKVRWAPLDLISRLARADESLSSSDSRTQFGVSQENLLGQSGASKLPDTTRPGKEVANIVVVGSGPAGLFAALVLAETGAKVTIVERGQPVEGRGKDIGALMVRRLLDPESNLCYGEGGAGTWSDGKLTTRIGKNSGSVQTVLATLVKFGAPANILMDGKPHVGTDKLVLILRAFRQHMQTLGVKFLFGTKMDDFIVRNGHLTGIHVSPVIQNGDIASPMILEADAVVLGVGHSARDVYENLHAHNVLMTAKDFAVGYRIEHPQELINEMQYHKWASEVQRGKGRVPVADYKVVANFAGPESTLPTSDEVLNARGCYSFCMCPGGQIVPTSTDELELCINGMSFSKRSSKWANAALVVTVPSNDFAPLVSAHGPLAGIAFQRAIEREAAVLGGGKLVSPAQTVPDFLEGRMSGNELPSSSYRLGVKASPLHELLPSHLTNTIKQALVAFDSQLPGFIDPRALLHGVETRTSSPVRIERKKDTFESVSLPGLYPIGEGAGYAGGIVSAAVDGMNAGLALARRFNPEMQLVIY